MVSAEIDRFFHAEPPRVDGSHTAAPAAQLLSVARQVGFLRMTGRTLNSLQIVPAAVLKHLG